MRHVREMNKIPLVNANWNGNVCEPNETFSGSVDRELFIPLRLHAKMPIYFLFFARRRVDPIKMETANNSK